MGQTRHFERAPITSGLPISGQSPSRLNGRHLALLSINGDIRGNDLVTDDTLTRLQCRLNRLLFTPEIISMKDNLVSGTGFLAAGVLANGG
jgi:hypothetical protein